MIKPKKILFLENVDVLRRRREAKEKRVVELQLDRSLERISQIYQPIAIKELRKIMDTNLLERI